MSELIVYKRKIHEFAECLDPFIFSNEGIEHAEIVFSEIFEHAKNSIYIYCGGLNEKLTSRELYQNSVSSYLESKNKLYILLEKKPISISPMLNRIIENSKNSINIQCKYLDDSASINSHFKAITNNNIHFTVADNKAFRLEIDPINYQAICSFNNVEIAEKLTKIFLDYFDNATLMN